MAGYSRAYWIGETGGFQGADGLNRIYVEILVGDADRQWWEGRWLNHERCGLGSLETIVPATPDDPNALLDACLAFYTAPFRELPAYDAVRSQLGDSKKLDFDLHARDVPSAWPQLRREALPAFRQLKVMIGRFTFVDLGNYGTV